MVTKVVRNNRKKTLQSVIREYVESGSRVFANAVGSDKESDGEYEQGVIDHAEGYVRGNVHTNGLENIWSLFKRCNKGTYVSVEPFHLFRYLDAETFRYKNRKENDGARFSKVVESIGNKRLTYKEVIGGHEVEPLS